MNNIHRPPFSICLALVHNNNEPRNAYIRPQLAQLAAELEGEFCVRTIETAYQSTLASHSTSMALMRDIAYWRLEREWQAYRLFQDRFLPSAKQLCKTLYGKYIANRNDALKHWRRSSAIEVTVTDKHIRAWQQFLDSDATALICMEDDAVFKQNTGARLKELLAMLYRNHIDKFVYADLGGGCALSDLRIDRLEDRRDAEYRYYKMPVTNTACAYLLSRPLVSAFHSILVAKPWLRLIGIDWLMNKLLMSLGEQAGNSFCVHADPSIVDHGSVTGAYAPWERGH